jgi:hypothetical protein
MPDRFAEMNRLDVASDILYTEGEFIHAMPYRGRLQRTHAPDARDPRRRRRPMKPEVSAFLDKPQELLERADAMLGAG